MCGVVVVEHAKASWRHGCGEHYRPVNALQTISPCRPSHYNPASLLTAPWVLANPPLSEGPQGDLVKALPPLIHCPAGWIDEINSLPYSHWSARLLKVSMDYIHDHLPYRHRARNNSEQIFSYEEGDKEKEKTTAEELVIRVSASLKTLLSSFSSWELKHKI